MPDNGYTLVSKPCCYSCFRYLPPPPCAWRQVLLLLLPRFDGCWLVGWHSLWCKKRKRPRSPLAAPRKMVITSSPNGATRCDPVEWARQGSKGLQWEIHPYQLLVVSSNLDIQFMRNCGIQRQIVPPSLGLKIVALGSEFDRKLPHNLCPWLRSSHCNCEPCSSGRSKWWS